MCLFFVISTLISVDLIVKKLDSQHITSHIALRTFSMHGVLALGLNKFKVSCSIIASCLMLF